jgi:hypothetical protein
MLISAAVNILACELGIFSLKIGKNLGFFGVGNGTVYRYLAGKKTLKEFLLFSKIF